LKGSAGGRKKKRQKKGRHSMTPILDEWKVILPVSTVRAGGCAGWKGSGQQGVARRKRKRGIHLRYCPEVRGRKKRILTLKNNPGRWLCWARTTEVRKVGEEGKSQSQ